MQVTLDHTDQENYNVKTFWFKPEKHFDFTAGQFIEMFLDIDHPDDRGYKHWFTLSSSPTDALISITTKFFGEKASSFKKKLFGLKPGEQIKIVEPMGDFVLPKDKSIPLVFVAGGIGATPYHSMVKYLSVKHEQRHIQVLLAANKPEDILFEKLFKAYGAKIKLIVTQPSPDWKGETGKLNAQKIIDLVGNSDANRIYVSGPEPMVEAIEDDLNKHGISKNQLIFDYFPGYTADLK